MYWDWLWNYGYELSDSVWSIRSVDCVDTIYCKRIECVCDWIDKYGWVYEGEMCDSCWSEISWWRVLWREWKCYGMNVIVCWKRCDVVLENDNEVDSVQLNEWKRMTREWNKDNIMWIVSISCSLIENHCLLHFINWSIPLDDLNDNHHYYN